MSSLQFLVIHAVLNMDSLLFHGSQIRPVIGWLFPQLQFLHCPHTSYRLDRMSVKDFVAGLVSQSQYWLPCLVPEDGWFRLQYSPLYRMLPRIIIVESLGLLLHQVYTVLFSPIKIYSISPFQGDSCISFSVLGSLLCILPSPAAAYKSNTLGTNINYSLVYQLWLITDQLSHLNEAISTNLCITTLLWLTSDALECYSLEGYMASP